MTTNEIFFLGVGLGWALCGLVAWFFPSFFLPSVKSLNEDMLVTLMVQSQEEWVARHPEFAEEVSQLQSIGESMARKKRMRDDSND